MAPTHHRDVVVINPTLLELALLPSLWNQGRLKADIMDSVATTDHNPFSGPSLVTSAPSTEPQREIWTAASMGTEASLAFNESFTLTFDGRLDVGALQRAVFDVVSRHESLRLTFSADGTKLYLASSLVPVVGVENWCGFNSIDREEQWAALLARQVDIPFDLIRGPLFRTTIVHWAEKEYRFVFTAHHIVCDGWSAGALCSDLAALYNAHVGITTAIEPPASFVAYARQQNARQSDSGNPNEEYWVRQFSGDIPPLELPTLRQRPPQKTYASKRIDVVMDAELVGDIKRLGAKQGASLFVTLFAGFAALLSRLAGQRDVVIGIPAAGQSSGGLDSLVGHCVNMLPVRSNFDPDKPFTEALSRARSVVLDAFEHQDFTFGSLLKKLPIARDPSRLPLVSVVFNLDKSLSADTLQFHDLTVEFNSNPRHFENFDLFVNAVHGRERIVFECQYNTDLFEAAAIERWLDAYFILWREIIDKPDAALGDHSLLTTAERIELGNWIDANSVPVSVNTIHGMIEAAVDEHPDAIAVEFEGTRISYRELDNQANQLAHVLRSAGIRSDVLVGICLDRSIEMLVALLAVLKAGGAYVPLDPGYPRERLAFMIEDSVMPVLVTDRERQKEFASTHIQILCIDDEAPRIQPDMSRLDDELGAHANSLAYVIYTSGSTGKPKGVLIEHASVINLVSSLRRNPGLKDSDVVLAVTTLSFDIAVSELIFPLTVGAKVVIASREVASDGQLLSQLVHSSAVTFIDATPATYRLLLATGWTGHAGLRAICTGEAMPRDLAIELVECVGQLWNAYGPTETTVWSTFYEVTKPVDHILIGRPIDNTQMYILDERNNVVPFGVNGEIFIAGKGLARGYLNQPALSMDRFVPNPFSSAAGAKMYKTGDLGRYLPDGNIECLGRNDSQVKLRGFRIELGEIENQLLAHESVAQGIVMVREDRPGDLRLCAYVVSLTGIQESTLREHLKKTLPDYMIPQHFVVLDRMPLTPSGKIDRKALHAPSSENLSLDEVYVEPRNETERILAKVWKEALVVGRLGIHDDFFALGGHSLLASQVLSRLRRDYGINLPFRRIFEAPTVARMAKLIDLAQSPAERELEAPIPRRRPDAIVPLTFAQERQRLLEELEPAQRLVHSVRGTWQFDGRLNYGLFQRALDHIATRHEVLRMSIRTHEGQEILQVEPTVDLTIRRVDLLHLPEEQRDTEVSAQIERLHKEPFDLRKPPLFRSTLFRVGTQRHVYFTLRHTMVWDGWSYDIFLKELCSTYAELEAGRDAILPELAIGYGDYALWHRAWLASAELDAQVAWWTQHLGSRAPTLRMPLDLPRPPRMTHVGANERRTVSKDDADALLAIARASGSTLYTVLLAAYVALLHRYSGQDELLIGTPVRGRDRPELEQLIGNFVNTLALRIKVEKEQTFQQLLESVRNLTIDAFSHQDVPLELLKNQQPILQALFSLQDARERPRNAGNLSVKQLYRPLPIAGNDLTLWVMDYGDHLLAVLNYSTEIYRPATMQKFLDRYIDFLRQITQEPTQKLSGLAMIDDDELSRLTSFGNLVQSKSRNSWAYSEFEQQVGLAPNNDVLIHGQAQMSFAGLQRNSNRLAWRLTSKGIGVGATVAILLPRGFDLFSAVFAVLKCGAQIVLIDPSHPSSRNLALLQMAAPDCVLTLSAHQSLISRLRQTIVLDTDACSLESERDDTPPCPNAKPESTPAFSYFPSLNRVEAVTICHAALATTLSAIRQSLVSTDRVLVITESAPSGEYSFLELLLGPSLGAVSLLSDDESFNGSELYITLESRGIGVVVANSEMWCELLRSEHNRRMDVHGVVLEVPGSSIVEELLPRTKTMTVLHTRISLGMASFVRYGTSHAPRRTIGKPIGVTRAAILDDANQFVPVGVRGNLYVDAATPENSIELNYESISEAHQLVPKVNTGLRARWNQDGLIELATVDEPLSISGLRVNPSEVEVILKDHPAVRRSATTTFSVATGDQRLVTFFEANLGINYTGTEFRRRLREHLPEALVPKIFVEVESLPTLPDGNIDVLQLPNPFDSESRVERMQPRTETERRLAELWQSALQVRDVSVTDNFFDLGGQSLLCFNVLAQLEQQFGLRLSPRSILLNSLEQIASTIDEGASRSVRTSEVVRASGKDQVPWTSRALRKLRTIVGN
jgi:amino acid adenylation domain-containing protein